MRPPWHDGADACPSLSGPANRVSRQLRNGDLSSEIAAQGCETGNGSRQRAKRSSAGGEYRGTDSRRSRQPRLGGQGRLHGYFSAPRRGGTSANTRRWSGPGEGSEIYFHPSRRRVVFLKRRSHGQKRIQSSRQRHAHLGATGPLAAIYRFQVQRLRAPRHHRSCEGFANGGPQWGGMGPTGGPASGNNSSAGAYLSPQSEAF